MVTIKLHGILLLALANILRRSHVLLVYPRIRTRSAQIRGLTITHSLARPFLTHYRCPPIHNMVYPVNTMIWQNVQASICE